MTTPPEDEGLKIVRPEKPQPRLLQTAVSKAEPETLTQAIPPPGGRRRKFIAIFLLFTILFVFGFVYLVEWKQSQRVAAIHIDLPESPPATIPIPAGSAIPIPVASTGTIGVAAAPMAPGSVTAEMLHVTSIALGEPHLAVVNGKRLAEGESLLVATPAGVATLRVTRIEDGVVHFDYGGQLIDAKLAAPLSQKNPP
jgi:hypothetical protein